jgi:hypothetical protein
VFGAWLEVRARERQRSTLLVDDISSDLAASLAPLTAAVDDPDVDVAAEVAALAAQARSAIPSYLGLAASISGDPAVTFTAFADDDQAPAIRASLRMPLPHLPRPDAAGVGVALILYAGQPGAFVDLAADLAWLTGREHAEFELDQHLDLPAQLDGTVTPLAASRINQAIGLLIGRGRTPDEALREIDSHAARDAIDRAAAAARILADFCGQ